MNALANCDNMFGKLNPQIQKRIRKYIAKPTFENWDDIHCLIIKAEGMKTIWNAMIEFDSTFPRTGRSEDLEGNIITEWERIPAPFELLRAITEFTKERKDNMNNFKGQEIGFIKGDFRGQKGKFEAITGYTDGHGAVCRIDIAGKKLEFTSDFFIFTDNKYQVLWENDDDFEIE